MEQTNVLSLYKLVYFPNLTLVYILTPRHAAKFIKESCSFTNFNRYDFLIVFLHSYFNFATCL